MPVAVHPHEKFFECPPEFQVESTLRGFFTVPVKKLTGPLA